MFWAEAIYGKLLQKNAVHSLHQPGGLLLLASPGSLV
jgi:hypothetical protein